MDVSDHNLHPDAVIRSNAKDRGVLALDFCWKILNGRMVVAARGEILSRAKDLSDFGARGRN